MNEWREMPNLGATPTMVGPRPKQITTSYNIWFDDGVLLLTCNKVFLKTQQLSDLHEEAKQL